MSTNRDLELAQSRLEKHLKNRPGLGVADAARAAKDLLARRSEQWIAFFLAVTDERHEFKTKRELAVIAGIAHTQCESFWNDMRGMNVATAEGKKRVFLDGFHVRFRNRKVIKNDAGEVVERIDGGVYLHLATHGAMPRDLDRTITVTTRTATETYAANYRESANRQAEGATSLEERDEIEATRDDVITGPKPAAPLPLFATKAS